MSRKKKVVVYAIRVISVVNVKALLFSYKKAKISSCIDISVASESYFSEAKRGRLLYFWMKASRSGKNVEFRI